MKYEMKKLKLELKVNWKLSRNETLVKENFIITRGDYSSEVAPNTRYDETPKLIEAHFKELEKAKTMNLLWCNCFQSAINNILLKEQFAGDLFKALGTTKKDQLETSFSLPIMDLDDVAGYLKANPGYSFYKVKIKSLESLAFLEKIASLTDKPLRIDANEGFESLESYLEFEDKVKSFNIQFVEQPFPTSFFDEYIALKKISKFEIIADESLLQDFNAEKFKNMFHGINVKSMKSRGLENSKRLLLKAREHGLKTMVGCMIETSLGISEAMSLASLCDYIDLDGSLLLKNDPYSHLIKLEDGKISLT